jgi:hypothetical protein
MNRYWHLDAEILRKTVAVGTSLTARPYRDQSSRQLQEDFPHLRKRYWGQHMWARGLPLIGQPLVQLTAGQGRKIDQQLRQVELGINTMSAAGAGQAGQDGRGSSPARIAHEEAVLAAFLFAHLTLIEDGRYSSFAAKNGSSSRQARTQYGHILGPKTYDLVPDGTTTPTRLLLIHQ